VALCEYDTRYLAEHLELAGRYEDLHRLLAMETNQGANAWFAICRVLWPTTSQ